MINRDLYKNWFSKENMSKWKCPTCMSGLLQLDEDKFIDEYNSFTKKHEHHEEFNFPYDVTYTFTTLLTCSNSSCREVVTCSGTGCVENEQYSEYESSYVEYYKPLFFYPSLQIFKIPDDTPREVKKAIEDSFSLIFSNKSAAANKIRIALECLLTNLKVNNYTITRKRKRKRLTLHERILLLATKYDGLKEAIKWLGNSGSHCDEDMKFDDVFNGYDMLSFLLDEIYDNRHHHVKKLAKNINAKKGV